MNSEKTPENNPLSFEPLPLLPQHSSRLPYFLWLLIFLQALAIMAFGGIYLWTWSIILFVPYVILLIIGWQKIHKEWKWHIPKFISWSIIIFGLWLIIHTIWIRTTNISVPNAVQLTLDTWQIRNEFPVVFQQHRQILALLNWFIPGIILLIMPEILRHRYEASKFIFALVIIISFQAWYGIAQFVMAKDPIPFLNWPIKEHRLFWVSGSYLNYNTYACLLAIGFILGLGILVYWLASHRKITHIPRFKFIALIATLIVMTLAILLSMSRGGLLCWLFGIILFCMMIAFGRIFRHFVLRLFQVLVIIAIPLLIYIVAIGTGTWYDKFRELPSSMEGRFLIWQSSWPIFTNHPYMGCGGGNYHYALCHYMPQTVYDHIGPVVYTHNDYWQLILEYGSITFIFVVFIWIVWLVQVIQIFKQGQSIYPKPLWYSIISALCILLLHGIWDFSWHIPSHALLASILMGSLLAQRQNMETGS